MILAAKAQLNTGTCAESVHLSVCPSVPLWSDLNFFLFGPFSLLSCVRDSLLMTADDCFPMTVDHSRLQLAHDR